MKKIIALVLAMVTMLAVVGCTKTEQPSTNAPTPTTNKYNDGTYVAFGNGTDKGYGMVEVTIENDVIVDVQVTEFNGIGVEKGEAYTYEAFHTAKAEMPGRFVEANGTDVETVSGATGSSSNWILAVERALEKALVEPASATTLFNGTFYGVSDATDKGRSVALVTIEDDKIVEVKLLATTFTKDDVPKEVFKNEEYPYATFHEAAVEMAARFVEANGPEVDTFTGATGSSVQWKQAVERALEKATR
ncbi:FMN-binding protein [Serpentinicella alkaliphila]|uniref:Uncharacterized protein with FMN-binding domain n=1 Tax=Serpentinicella alkaliphila TaxID=1734049 RepID=A0A4R2THG4_9FIRM|nr:FMN-binding protein [Serpentinicella alkaliphila]QUH24630.1 FMN-binding protein [Serpentinicella alkaliphila]TCQ02631.1 uncharacterized protein with FMN-binding domain [Serpentinicella alkaliphila]